MWLIVGIILAGLAALLHVYIFYLESIAWTGKAARATFGTTQEQAETMKPMAFNQGFYNLFLAIAVFAGIAFFATGHTTIGATLVLTGAGSMAAAALVLFASSPRNRGAALKQGVVPLLSVVTVAIGLAVH